MEKRSSWDFYIDDVEVLEMKDSDEEWQGVGIYDGNIEFCRLNSKGEVFFDKGDETSQLKDSDTITYGQFKQFMKYFISHLREDLTSIAEM